MAGCISARELGNNCQFSIWLILGVWLAFLFGATVGATAGLIYSANPKTTVYKPIVVSKQAQAVERSSG